MLAHRSQLPELMDGPDVSSGAIHQALHELEIVGKHLGGYALTTDALAKVTASGKDVTVMDLGCGGGDTLRAVARWNFKTARQMKLIGVDRNPEMITYAANLSTAYPSITYITADVFDDALLSLNPGIVISSLFCHHFDDDALVRLVQRMYNMCTAAVIINDLHRHPFAYYAIRLLTRLFSKSYLVKYDAPLSVARSFTRQDWQHILLAAGITSYTISWRWAWRWQLIIYKQSTTNG